MAENRTYNDSPTFIPSRLESSVHGLNPVADAKDIYDINHGKWQKDINDEIEAVPTEIERIDSELGNRYTKSETYSKTEVDDKDTTLQGNINTLNNQINGNDGIDERLSTVEELAQISIDGGTIGIATASDFDNPTPEQEAKVTTVGAILGITDDIPVPDSDNLIKSGGVAKDVFPVTATVDDVVYLNATADVSLSDFQAADIDNFRFSFNYKAPYDGRVTKLIVTSSTTSFAVYTKTLTVIQLRPNESETSYTEVDRVTLAAFNSNTYEYPMGFDVKKGDIFGYSGRVFQKVITGAQVKQVAFSENTISFNVSDLSGYTNRHPCIVPVLTPYKEKEMLVERKDDIEIKKNNLVEGLVIQNKLINDLGNIFDSANTASVVFPANEKSTYLIYHQNGEWYDHMVHIVSFFDGSMSLLGTVRANKLSAYDETHRYIFPIAGTKFIGYNIKYGDFDYSENLIIQEGTSPTDATKYNISSINNKEVLHSYPGFLYDIPLNTYIMGDSIAVNGYSKWHDYILNKFSFKNFISVAQGGATWAIRNDADYSSISNVTWNSSEAAAPENVIARQIYKLIDGVDNNNQPTPELIFIHCGVNDSSYIIYPGMAHGRSLGSADTVFDFDNPDYTDWSQVAINSPYLLQMVGAIRFCIETIWRKWPLCKIVITTPIQRSRVEGESAVVPVRNVREQILKCGVYISVPVLDMYQEASIYTPMTSTFLSDGLHPNDTNGGKRFADVIGRYLKGKFGFKKWY